MPKAYRGFLPALLLLGLVAGTQTARTQSPEKRYQPSWKSLDTRPMPRWFNEAKFGIFVVWGPYSVPAYMERGAYAEWYGKRIEEDGSPAQAFHLKNYGRDFKYEQFADMFRAELFDPEFWTDIFVRSGAKYVVTTANYHDGFAMYPTEYSRTANTDQWNAMVRGPKRDLLGELNEAGRKRGLQMGIYYSLYEWWHPLWLSDRDRYVQEHFHPKFKEVVTRYKPPVIFLDGEWEWDDKGWRSEELAAWLYNDSPVADIVAVNDRWGQSRSRHGDYFSSEYGGGDYPPTHAWQEDRGIGRSYGYNRNESIDDYNSGDDLIRLLSMICGNGGNLLLDIGPTADGRIPVIMQDRLLEIGEWLETNGEAIYGSAASPFWPRRLPWGTATSRDGRIFLHLHQPNRRVINLRGLNSEVRSARLLSNQATVKAERNGQELRLTLPEYRPDEPVTVITLELSGPVDVDTIPHQEDDNTIYLHCYGMEVHGQTAEVEFDGYRHIVHIGGWTDPNDYVTAEFVLRTPGEYRVEIEYSTDTGSAGGEVAIEVGGRTVSGPTDDTGGWNKYETQPLGNVVISEAGQHTMTIRPKDASNWKGIGLKSVSLIPVTVGD